MLFMDYWAYILKSLRITAKKNYYIGHTNNLKRRLVDHNRGKDHSSKCGRPWKIVYKKTFNNRCDAIKHEIYLKKLKNKKYLEKIINIAG